MKIGITPPLNLAPFFPGGGSPMGIAPGAEMCALWSAAGGGAEGEWYRIPDDPRLGSWSTMLIVDEAPFSQYDGLIGHLRSGLPLPDRMACIALTGREFHGQRNRPWSARRGNLHLVVHFAPRRPVAMIGHGFTLLPAVACIRAIRNLSGGAIPAGIKWVNDIMVGNRKVGGFLAFTQIQAGIVEDVVLGMGLNIGSAPEVEPTPFVPAVGCLGELHATFTLHALLPALLKELHELYGVLLADGFLPLMQAYREYAAIVGRRVRIWPETEESSADRLRGVPPLARGVVTGIADDLSLLVEGHAEPISRGRLAEEEACRGLGL